MASAALQILHVRAKESRRMMGRVCSKRGRGEKCVNDSD